MPTGAEVPELLVDTSVALAMLIADHDSHAATMRRIGQRCVALAGHAAFEVHSVLTRLPSPLRRTPKGARELLQGSFAPSRFLSPLASERLADELATLGIAGGAVYDALVGAAAREHGLPLATRDRRALDTYRALEIAVELLA